MTDDWIEPIGDVQRAIGASVEVHRAKGVVSGGENGREGLQLVTRAIHAGPKPGDVARVITGDQEITLKILG